MDKEDTISRSGSSESDEKQQPPRLFESIHAGFPSPAEDIPGTALDINRLVENQRWLHHPVAFQSQIQGHNGPRRG